MIAQMDVIILLSLEKEQNALFRSDWRKDSNETSVISYCRCDFVYKSPLTHKYNMYTMKKITDEKKE